MPTGDRQQHRARQPQAEIALLKHQRRVGEQEPEERIQHLALDSGRPACARDASDVFAKSGVAAGTAAGVTKSGFQLGLRRRRVRPVREREKKGDSDAGGRRRSAATSSRSA
jgi:hypothetical protein